MKFALFVTLACAWGAYDVAARAAIQTEANKVVGGEVAKPGQFPYQVSLQDAFGSHFCGGSLIAPDLVITAAHCIQGQWDFLLWIVAGFNSQSNEGQAQSRRVSKMEYHGSFGQGLANDIAYIRLDNPFDLTDLVQTVKLPSAGLTPSLAAGDCTVSGWGATSISSSGQPSYPDEMHFGNIQGLSDEDCLALFDAMPNPPQGAEVVPEANFCAYTPEGGLNACFGDSGGPLVCTANEDGERYLFGVVSWGPAPYCGEVGFPAVYTDVVGYLDWITSNTGVSV